MNKIAIISFCILMVVNAGLLYHSRGHSAEVKQTDTFTETYQNCGWRGEKVGHPVNNEGRMAIAIRLSELTPEQAKQAKLVIDDHQGYLFYPSEAKEE